MSGAPQILLTRSDLAALMLPRDYLAAAEAAFTALAGGRASAAMPMHMETTHGVFHVKGGAYQSERGYVAVKLNGNFPGNPERTGLPTIQGAILLCDADNGSLLCILDSAEVTLRRTAAASALAARHLAPINASTLLLCGCGVQALAHAEALADLFTLETVLCWDQHPEKADALAARIRANLSLHAQTATDLAAATRSADIIVTCTTSTAPFLGPENVQPGAFIAAVGADNPGKREIAPALMAQAAVVCDSAAQCAAMGDLHHALEDGALAREQVRAELSEIVAGVKAGRWNEREIVIFDSTGLAVQDAAAAAMAYQRALQEGRGMRCSLHG
jgi:ornithine cyclodeaminase/alanine dehydrogenase-like protein (mu-crystallin family)